MNQRSVPLMSPDSSRDARRQAYGERLRSWFADLMKATGLNQTDLARGAGVDPGLMSKIIMGKTEVPTRGTINKFVVTYSYRLPPELEAGPSGIATPSRQPGIRVASPRPAAIEPGTVAWDVPIYPLVGADIEKSYTWQRFAIDFTLRGRGISNSRRVFALRMPDASMSLWRRADELIFVDEGRQAREGDHGFLELQNPESPKGPNIWVIRRVLVRGPKIVRLACYGRCPEEVDIPYEQVLKLHRILEWSEAYGAI